jgi:hypothetical protein
LKKILIILFVFITILPEVKSQNLINTRRKIFQIKSDTLLIDTLSIWQESIKFYDIKNEQLLNFNYEFDFFKSAIIFKEIPKYDSIAVEYKVFPVNYSKPISLFDKSKHLKAERLPEKKYDYVIERDYLRDANLNKDLSRRGSISRGVNFGNNQNVSLNSGLNLQLDGKLNEEIYIVAAISDNNIPIQPEGNTQYIQEFDKVFIKLYNENLALTFGDFELRKPTGFYMNYLKKVQGASISVKQEKYVKDKKFGLESSLSGAATKGKFHRLELRGQEGNQGPYKLTGANNEQNIIILAGSEKVFVDGILQVRGLDNQYVIDYNTGEITFTPKQPINKDKRIIIEFEYTEKSYTRFLIGSTNKVTYGNSEFYLNFYQEKDSKNSPIDQDLTPYERFLLMQAGDNTEFARVPAFDSIGFSTEEIRYELRDSIVKEEYFDSIFVYSTNPIKAIYRVRFVYSGPNKGNYKRSINTVNGRVFEWVAPENGIPQGDYEPYKILISPEQKQLINFGVNVKLDEKTTFSTEIAISNNDKNTFSNKDADDNQGLACISSLERSFLKNDKNLLSVKITYSYQQKYFRGIENYRTPEFTRDWNFKEFYPESDENFLNFTLNFNSKNSLNSKLEYNLLKRGSVYTGNNGGIQLNYQIKKLNISGKAYILDAETQVFVSRFIRHNFLVTQSFKYFMIGVGEEAENNQLKDNNQNVLNNNSFAFQSFNCFVKTIDSTKLQLETNYKLRKDFLATNYELSPATQSDNLSFILNYNLSSNHRISSTATFRRLNISDNSLYSNPSENNLVGRLEYSYKILKGVFSGNCFYETGSGMERKIEFSYLEVPTGQGVYTWTDYNNNGIKELDEFEVAFFNDQANYIRIFIPSSEYIKTYSNQFSYVLNTNPDAVWQRSEFKIKKFISRFSNQFAFRTGTKNTSDEFFVYANPFINNIEDINILSMNQNIRNSFSFNRTNPKFGADYIYQLTNNKMLLISGFETRNNYLNTFQTRYFFSPNIGIEGKLNFGRRVYNSEFFNNKNYLINNNFYEGTVIYQPNVNLRFSGTYILKNKINLSGTEVLNSNEAKIEGNFFTAKKSFINSSFSIIYNNYNSQTNTPIAYEMLEGLQPGLNFTWNVTIQRMLTNGLQINIIYNARKSPGVKVIHNAGVQMRAFF